MKEIIVNQYLTLGGCILLGQLFHILIKIRSLMRRSDAAKELFDIRAFFRKDWIEISIALVAGIIVLVAYSEISGVYPIISIWKKISFLLVGYAGSSIVLAFFSSSEKAAINTIKNKVQEAENIVNDQTNNMENYEWALAYEDNEDEISLEPEEGYFPLGDFANQTGGQRDGVKKEILYSVEPIFTQATLRRLDTTTYVAGPVRRPTGA